MAMLMEMVITITAIVMMTVVIVMMMTMLITMALMKTNTPTSCVHGTLEN